MNIENTEFNAQTKYTILLKIELTESEFKAFNQATWADEKDIPKKLLYSIGTAIKTIYINRGSMD